MTALTQRVHEGAIYTDGLRIAEVTKVYDIGYVVMRDSSTEHNLGFGIDAFRREWWLVKSAPAFDDKNQPDEAPGM